MNNNLYLNISDKLLNYVTSGDQREQKQIQDNLEKINFLGRDLPGKHFNLNVGDAYSIKNRFENIYDVIQTEYQLFMAPLPAWIKEHYEFRYKLYDEIIMPSTASFSRYLKETAKLNAILVTGSNSGRDGYFLSYQAVFYSHLMD